MPDTCDPEPHTAYLGIPTFMGTPLVQTASELRDMNADVAVLGAPVDTGMFNRPGARFGPRAIRQASHFSTNHKELHHIALDVHPLNVLKVVDFGDANCPPGSLELGHKAVESKVSEALDAGALPIVLGGDHSVTLPSATAVARRYGFGNVGMVHFDAHADTRESGYGDILISHGSPMRRLIESGAFPGRNFVQIGLRGYFPSEIFDWMRRQNMRWHEMSEIEERGFDAVIDDSIVEVMEGPPLVYMSVDIDVLDPAFAPGTGVVEPGGITSAELLRALRRIVTNVNLVAMDVVEVSPPYDGPSAITSHVAHRVVLEVISALARLKRDGPGSR